MTKTVFGLEEAPADFDEHFGKVSEDLYDECGSLCLTRLMSEPATCQSKLTGVMMCKHMDDGVLLGPNEALDRTLTALGKILLLKTSCPQLGSETKFLGRLLIKTERGFLVKPLAKLFDSLLSCAVLENCNPVHSPGVLSESRIPDEKPVLGPAEHSQYRTIVGKLSSSLLNAQIFNSVSRNVPEECKVLQLETCRGQSASADISWVLAIGH